MRALAPHRRRSSVGWARDAKGIWGGGPSPADAQSGQRSVRAFMGRHRSAGAKERRNGAGRCARDDFCAADRNRRTQGRSGEIQIAPPAPPTPKRRDTQMIRSAWFFVFVWMLPAAAWAQSGVILMPNPLGHSTSPAAATITSTHGAVIPAGTYGFGEIENQSGSAFVYCIWGGASVAAATAGQYTIPPLGGYVWDSLNPPPANQALDCISSAASSPATVRVY